MDERGRITLSLTRAIAEKAKRIARAQGISVSALFVRFVEENDEETPDEPLTQGSLPNDEINHNKPKKKHSL